VRYRITVIRMLHRSESRPTAPKRKRCTVFTYSDVTLCKYHECIFVILEYLF